MNYYHSHSIDKKIEAYNVKLAQGQRVNEWWVRRLQNFAPNHYQDRSK